MDSAASSRLGCESPSFQRALLLFLLQTAFRLRGVEVELHELDGHNSIFADRQADQGGHPTDSQRVFEMTQLPDSGSGT
jgi:hypothetical protein